MSSITIYHNPACGTSRNVLGLIRNSGEEPAIIEYLKTPPDAGTLKSLISAMGVRARDVLRQKGTLYDPSSLLPSVPGCAARPRQCWTSCRKPSATLSTRKTASR